MKKTPWFDVFRSRIRRSLDTNKQRVVAALQKPYIRGVIAATETPLFARIYLLVAVTVLFVSTLFWALLGARLNLENSDQLVNAYLFKTSATFHESLLPGAHTFLLKWPLFLLIKAFGFTANAYVGVTVLTVIATVAIFALVLYRIERRPLILGTILLALASILMLVPATASAGTLLPVNMAMLATRNIEYVIYIAALGCLIPARRLHSIKFWIGVVLLILLAASDKLFLYLSVGGAIIALTAYGLSSGWNLVGTAARWMLAGLISALGAVAALWAISTRHITHISSQTGAGPYGVIHTLHDLALGLIYCFLHLLTNFGANPAAQTTLLRNVRPDAVHQLFGFSGISYLVNLTVLIVTLVCAYQIIGHSLAHNKDRNVWLSPSAKLSIALIWSSVAAVVLFVMSTHYYVADARYLGIIPFGLLTAAATFINRKAWQPSAIAGIGLVLLISIILAIPGVLHEYHGDLTALAPIHDRNSRIAAALAQHPVKVLVGDYWRVLPVETASHSKIAFMPLAGCTTPRDTLSSKVWQPDLNKNSFAYVLSFDASLTDFPHCSLNQVIAAYGRPNASVVIAGNLQNPREIVLFYDNGKHLSAPITKLATPSTVLPVELEELPYTACKQPTIMNIVAHEDDDLLFMNPDLSKDLAAGDCVRTIYVTAGDAGLGPFYWLGRQQGSQAAYSKMLGFSGIWVQRVVHLSGNRYVTIANPRGNNKISLIYLHLPDGNLKGQGFAAHNYESLASLDAGKISTIQEVYNNGTYRSIDLKNALTDLMFTYQPTEIHTQSNNETNGVSDHSDHMAVGRFAQRAHDQYQAEHFAGRISIPIKYYQGYPGRAKPANVFGGELNNKETVFSLYYQFDHGVPCRTIVQCRTDPAYGAFLPRQYLSPY